MGYPDGLGGGDICLMEGCIGGGVKCPRCGEINYSLRGYLGAMARWGGGIKEQRNDNGLGLKEEE